MKSGHEFEKEQEKVYVRVWRKEREMMKLYYDFSKQKIILRDSK